MTLRAGPAGPGDYVALLPDADERHVARTDLAALPASLESSASLLTVAHLSDIHVCDAQSPARVEFIDRWSDPDSPVRELLGEVGTYRAQEILTTQVAAAMVAAVNAVGVGPVAGAPLDFAIATGDNIDNSQANELDWYLAVLDGGRVHPDSGDPARYEGVADDVVADERFWHPSGLGSDLPRTRFGFPAVPGLLDAVRQAFTSPGLSLPWLAVHGNHDQMLQGTWPGDALAGAVATGASKSIEFGSPLTSDEIVALMVGLNELDPAAMAVLDGAVQRGVTPDAGRRIITRDEFMAAHRTPGARPPAHGFGALPYYRFDHSPRVTMLVLDTVNEHGGWQGSLDLEQLSWLEDELASADSDQRYAVLASHHPLSTMINDRVTASAGRRVLGAELSAVLARHPSLVLWLNGHTHATAVVPHGTWWEVTAPSLIDWPQQARVVELLDSGSGTLTIAATMLDHAGEAPWSGSIDGLPALAGLSRELAANDWQWRSQPLSAHPRGGAADERNVLLAVPDPWA